MAHQSGFYDQSHFNKDFAAFTGDSPTDYRRRRRFHAEKPEHARFLGNLTID
jgi:AraC-like DNA-binding protein